MLGVEGYLPRPGKKPRRHAILSIRDAIVLRALVDALIPIWQLIPAQLIGGRPGSSASEAARTIYEYIKGGGAVLRADLVAAYDRTPWQIPLNILWKISDRPELCALLAKFYETQEIKFPGLVEGTAVSSLLLAIALGTEVTPFVEIYADRFQVYGDDIVIGANKLSRLNAAGDALRERLAALGLAIHTDGNKKMVITKGPFTYLGFTISEVGMSPSSASCDSLVIKIDKAIMKAKNKPEKVRNGRRVIAAWAGYFAHTTEVGPLENLDAEIRAQHPEMGRELPKLVDIVFDRNPRERGRNALRQGRDRMAMGHQGDSPDAPWIPKGLWRLAR
ncbi:MAG: hypothetical protein MJE77_18905 [Proteobacteria bacterium]|nr:hypothetical protein [Pseudomonadota bacterium]